MGNIEKHASEGRYCDAESNAQKHTDKQPIMQRSGSATYRKRVFKLIINEL